MPGGRDDGSVAGRRHGIDERATRRRRAAEPAALVRPQQDLDRCGMGASLFRAPRSAVFRPLLEMEADRARQFYESGRQLIAYVDLDCRPALWTLVEIYSQLLAKIAALG